MSRCWKITSSTLEQWLCRQKKSFNKPRLFLWSTRALGSGRKDPLSFFPWEKQHNGHSWKLQLLPSSLSHGSGRLGRSSCFSGAEGERLGEKGPQSCELLGSIDLGDTERWFLQLSPRN